MKNKFNLLILAAGKGRRLGKKAKLNPKILMNFQKRPILDYQFDVYKNFPGVKINLVVGYKGKKIANYLKNKKVKFFKNNKYKTTNMFYSFLKAYPLLNQKKDLVIVYGDIIFKSSILKKLIMNKYKLSISVDKNYLPYWKKRMKFPLKDLETMKIKNGHVIELGNKPKNLAEIQGQYMGLIKFSYKKFNQIKKIIEEIKKKKNFENMYFTDFLQILISKKIKVKAIISNGGWQEFDKPKDFRINNLKG